MPSPRILDSIGEQVEHWCKNLLNRLIFEEFSPEPLPVGKNWVSPLVVFLVGIEVRRDNRLSDSCAASESVAGKQRCFGCKVASAADCCSVVEVVSAIRPKPPLKNVVRVLTGVPAIDALVAVAR